MTGQDASRRIDRITILALVDWAIYVGVILVGAVVHFLGYRHYVEQLPYRDVEIPTLTIVFNIQMAAMWLAILLIMGMVRLRIVLRGIRRDGLELQLRKLGPAPANTTDAAKGKTIECPECNQKLLVPNGYRHHSAKCRECGHAFTI